MDKILSELMLRFQLMLTKSTHKFFILPKLAIIKLTFEIGFGK